LEIIKKTNSLNKFKILVIGGTGFIGRNLLLKLSQNNYSIYSFSLNIPKKNNKIPGINYLKGSLLNSNSFNKLIKIKFHYIVNLGGYINHKTFFTKESDIIIESHFLSIIRLVNRIDKRQLKHFIQIGTSDEYGLAVAPQKEDVREKPLTPYSFSKAALTKYFQALYIQNNFPVTILRLFLVYGPGQKKDRLIPYVIDRCLKNKTVNIYN
jgi:nucleoside-diphosphate-sugar epimerase